METSSSLGRPVLTSTSWWSLSAATPESASLSATRILTGAPGHTWRLVGAAAENICTHAVQKPHATQRVEPLVLSVHRGSNNATAGADPGAAAASRRNDSPV